MKAPLTVDELKAYIDNDLLAALLMRMLADSGGWNPFDQSTLESIYRETREIFAICAHVIES